MPPVSPASQVGSLPLSHQGGPIDQVMIAKMTHCISQEEGARHVRRGWVWVPLELTRERETVAKAFIVISMGVWTLIKKKKKRKNHVFYQQNDFIWEEQKIAIRDEQTVVKHTQVQRTEEGG